MIPRIGRTVIVTGYSSNGATDQPAIITRTYSSKDTREGAAAVNLTILPDCGMPVLRSSVMLFETRHEADAWRFGNVHAIAAFWPEGDGGPEPEAAVAAAPAQLAA